MSIYLSADLHYGESSERLKMMNRPFKDTYEMIECITKNFNSVITKNDTLYILGDVCWMNAPEFLTFIDLLNAKSRILVKGNHDRNIPDKEFQKYFDQIIPEGDGIELQIDGMPVPCWLTHYPTKSKKTHFNCVAHIHSAFRYQLNMFNCGIDVNWCRPVPIEYVPHLFKSIHTYYDDDAWAAYHPSNMEFVGKRGKKGSYSDSIV